MPLARDGQCLGRLQHRCMHLNGEDGMALQRLAARYRPAALRQPDLERGSARWAVDLEPGGGRRRAKAARHGRRTTARAERQSTCTSPWEKLALKNPEALRAPLKRCGARSPLSGAGGSKSRREGLQLRTRERVHSHPFLIPPGNRPPQLSGLHASCREIAILRFNQLKVEKM